MLFNMVCKGWGLPLSFMVLFVRITSSEQAADSLGHVIYRFCPPYSCIYPEGHLSMGSKSDGQKK